MRLRSSSEILPAKPGGPPLTVRILTADFDCDRPSLSRCACDVGGELLGADRRVYWIGGRIVRRIDHQGKAVC